MDYVRETGDQIPLVKSYGNGLEIVNEGFDKSQDQFLVEYSITANDETEAKREGTVKGVDELERQRESRRLERAIEVSLSSSHGWDVRITVKGVGENIDVGWTSAVEGGSNGQSRTTLRISHAALTKPDQLVKVTLSIQRLAGGKAIKVNGEPIKVVSIEARDPSFYARQLLDDAASIISTGDSQLSATSSYSLPTPYPHPVTSEINALLRRNYIYFTSLLQEPEAKWRHVSDSQGVTVTQLNSIDPTLTIYRAEATFVGVGVWDVFSTICTPGARMQWDKTLDDAVLLDDISELSSLWHLKTKAAWPVA